MEALGPYHKSFLGEFSGSDGRVGTLPHDPTSQPPCEQTDTTGNITFKQTLDAGSNDVMHF